MSDRIVPELPSCDKKIKLIIDSDAANEIDDLYAIVMALAYPERFDIMGFVATHFAQRAGRDSIDQSYALITELLEKSGMQGRYSVFRGSEPMRYPNTPTDGEGVDFIVKTARSCTPDAPLWVVGIGAATNMASALLKAPDIAPTVRYVFHGRSEATWPERTEQFNVYGDIIAAKVLLESDVPLVWFDTGTNLCASYETTKERLAPKGGLGKYLHDFRDRHPYFALPDKGFFDMGDFTFLLDPDSCESEIIDAPELTRFMYFEHTKKYGKMLRVYSVDFERTWALFYDGVDRLMDRGVQA